jgi:hypothetical protein
LSGRRGERRTASAPGSAVIAATPSLSSTADSRQILWEASPKREGSVALMTGKAAEVRDGGMFGAAPSGERDERPRRAGRDFR